MSRWGSVRSDGSGRGNWAVAESVCSCMAVSCAVKGSCFDPGGPFFFSRVGVGRRKAHTDVRDWSPPRIPNGACGAGITASGLAGSLCCPILQHTIQRTPAARPQDCQLGQVPWSTCGTRSKPLHAIRQVKIQNPKQCVSTDTPGRLPQVRALRLITSNLHAASRVPCLSHR
jgi:hypothetical protein